MDTPDIKPSVSAPDLAEVQAQCESLRQLVASLLVLLVVISGTLNIFFWRLYRSTQGEVQALRQVVTEYNQKTVPAVTNLIARLTEFEKKNPDITSILHKYGITNSATPTAASPLAPAGKK